MKDPVRDERYYKGFISYLSANKKEKYKQFFSDDYTFVEFVKSHFLKFPIKEFYESVSFHNLMEKMIHDNFYEIHQNIDQLLKLLTFYKIPTYAFNMYEEVFPEYFDPKFEKHEKFMSALFKYQEVPKRLFANYLKEIKSNKNIAYSVITSEHYGYYYDLFFQNDRVLFNAVHKTAVE